MILRPVNESLLYFLRGQRKGERARREGVVNGVLDAWMLVEGGWADGDSAAGCFGRERSARCVNWLAKRFVAVVE